MTEMIQGQMSPDQALLQAKFNAVYQAARQLVDMQDSADPWPSDGNADLYRALKAFPSEIIELLTKDPEDDES